MFIGAWRRSQKLGRRVEARVSLVEAHSFRFCRSEDDKAVLAARVTEIQAGSQERSAARVRVPGAIIRAWWCVWLQLEIG